MFCRLNDRLAALQKLFGLLQMRRNPLLLELALECGYEFVVLDNQLGVFDDEDFKKAMTELVATQGVLSMVRVDRNKSRIVERAIQCGVDAIIVPHVSAVEDAEPLATRLKSNPLTSLIVIIESALGARNAEEILAVDGVAGAIVGPINLSTDLGHPRDYTHPSYEAAFTQIERAAISAEKILGTVPNHVYPAAALASRGHRLLILGSDQMLLRSAMIRAAKEARGAFEPGFSLSENK